jgi:hypothetical protein
MIRQKKWVKEKKIFLSVTFVFLSFIIQAYSKGNETLTTDNPGAPQATHSVNSNFDLEGIWKGEKFTASGICGYTKGYNFRLQIQSPTTYQYEFVVNRIIFFGNGTYTLDLASGQFVGQGNGTVSANGEISHYTHNLNGTLTYKPCHVRLEGVWNSKHKSGKGCRFPDQGTFRVKRPVIRTIFLIPTDYANNQEFMNRLSLYITLFSTHVSQIKSWYYNRLKNKYFRTAEPVIVSGDKDGYYYRTNDGIVSELPAIHQKAFGEPPCLDQPVLLVAPGLEGWAGGAGGIAPFAVVGFDALLVDPPCAGLWWCTPEIFTGTCIHELGHVFGVIEHSKDPDSIMINHTDYNNKILTPGEIAIIEKHEAALDKYW